MKKKLGAVNTKVIGIVAVIVVVVGLIYAFSQGGGMSSVSNNAVIKTADIIGKEFTNTMEDYMPDMGVKEFNEKIQKDGAYSTGMKLSGEYPFAGKIDLGFDAKSDPNAKKMELVLNIGAVGATLDATITAINNEIFLNIPSMYGKPMKINFATIGADLQSDVFKNMAGGQDMSKYKDLKVNLFSDYSNPSKMKSEFEKTVSPELDTIIKNAKVEKVDVEKAFADKLKEAGSTKSDLTQINVEMDSKDFKALAIKVADFYETMQKSQIQGISDEDYQSSFKNMKESIEKSELPEKMKFKMVSSGDIPVLLSIEGEGNSRSNIMLAGNKNVTDKVVLYESEGDSSQDMFVFEMKTGDKENTLNVNVANGVELTSIYKKGSKEIDMSVKDEMRELISLKGKYTDVKAGESYNMDIQSLSIPQSSGSPIEFKGTAYASVAKPDIKAVSGETVEVLKLTQAELMEFVAEVSKNLQNNYGGLMSMMNGGY